VSLQFSDPLVGAALVAGVFGLAVALVNGIVQIICTWLQTRSKKPPARKPKPKARSKKRYRPSALARPPPQWCAARPISALCCANQLASRTGITYPDPTIRSSHRWWCRWRNSTSSTSGWRRDDRSRHVRRCRPRGPVDRLQGRVERSARDGLPRLRQERQDDHAVGLTTSSVAVCFHRLGRPRKLTA
jgi:hypothetical protein